MNNEGKEKKEVIFSLNNVGYTYPDGTVALENINMKIYKGEILAIIGSNGAGKTTLLKIIDGLEFPDSGEIYFEGEKLTEKKLRNKEFMKYFRSKVGFVFQDPDIMLFSPTVWDDVAFGPLHLYSKEEALDLTEKTIDELKITNLKDRHPYNISGGEKKKASIASVLSMIPDVILMDEPASYLDPRNKRYIKELIKELNKKSKTIVFVSHDPSLVSIADRCYVLNKTIVYEGSPKEVFSNIELLKNENLDVPEIAKLFKRLQDKFGNEVIPYIPINEDEACELMEKLMKNFKK
ncbi:energy-coupling factor ABC transporter ATP-binding protein [Methanothermococcus okinawensis]|uniref:Sulfate-transporting ATPase n=1 Tax=Methanothermococcus okinawensis (strain DSM 14208 / JCM 11175 / IH1) TaxID=647113 RepID=F8AK51_METOI|nr:energy-coupling factor ABC transporter ATP-binding protein [Methanothermococcus okinawensis]AEH07418.1 Sulfate-transporting ATPase [Methanothermococcus okinawensis IH1]